jgi:leucyl aminopeptidase
MRRLGGWVRPALTAAGFDGSHGQTAVLPVPEGGLGRVVFVGLGDELDLEALRQAAAAARRAVDKADTLATTLHRVGLDGAPGAVIDGLAMASYRFDIYKSAAPTRPEPTVALVGSAPEWEEAAARSREVVAAVSLARDLVNEPSINKPPMVMARRLADEATAAGMTAEIWDAGRLAEERMGGILGVGAGSDRPPCLLRLSHRPKRKRPRSRLAFVGKGIVFDTGGISIKPADRMEEMKADMAGAAAVCAAAIAISRLGLPVEVSAYAALAENMPSGAAQRPGDVLTARNGKTIEVINTDAEGRLVLADAIALAAESVPDVIVDLATLTGACKVALGPKIAGVLGNDQAWIDRVLAAARSVGERVWQLPLPSDHRSMIDSDVADMKNTGGSRYGGAITAALLLAEFPGETPWVHLDIAGPAYGDKTEHYLPKGGTGFGVRTLVELAEAAS